MMSLPVSAKNRKNTSRILLENCRFTADYETVRYKRMTSIFINGGNKDRQFSRKIGFRVIGKERKELGPPERLPT